MKVAKFIDTLKIDGGDDSKESRGLIISAASETVDLLDIIFTLALIKAVGGEHVFKRSAIIALNIG